MKNSRFRLFIKTWDNLINYSLFLFKLSHIRRAPPPHRIIKIFMNDFLVCYYFSFISSHSFFLRKMELGLYASTDKVCNNLYIYILKFPTSPYNLVS